MKATGFAPEQSAAILLRDGGVCSMAGHDPRCEHRAIVANHRANRGSGGHRASNRIANGCALCNWCNGHIEADATAHGEAIRRGVKISRDDDPEAVPLWSVFYRQWIVLHDTHSDLTGIADDTLSARAVHVA